MTMSNTEHIGEAVQGLIEAETHLRNAGLSTIADRVQSIRREM
jgi:hypothetical protein